jgi:hypothetical protein
VALHDSFVDLGRCDRYGERCGGVRPAERAEHQGRRRAQVGFSGAPGTYVAVPLYFYTADQIEDRDGKQLRTGNLDASVFGIALNVVTTRKIAGGTCAWLQSMGIEAGDWAVASGGTLDRRGDGRYLAVHRQP